MRVTPTSTRRSDEISFVMNAKPWRSRSWNSGTILMPWMPQTKGSPSRVSRGLLAAPAAGADRQTVLAPRAGAALGDLTELPAGGAATLDRDRGVHALVFRLDPHP